VRFDVFIAVKIQVKVFWIVMLKHWFPTAILHSTTTQKTLT